MKRILFSVTLSLCLLVTGFSTVLAVHNEGYTPQDYVDYLTEKGKTDPEALKIKKQFQSLSIKKQKKFIYYMTNPQIIAQVLSTPVPENSRKELYNGDIVIEHTTETKIIEEEPEKPKGLSSITALFCGSCFAAPSVKEYRHTDTRFIAIGGLRTGSTTAWVQYKVVNGKVKSIQGGDGWCANHSPISNWTKESVSRYIYGNKAHTAIVWKASPCLVTKYLSLSSIGFIHHHHVLGFANGGKTYRAYRE